MKKFIDPPSGWKYGFPKEIPPDVVDEKEWLVEQGYPRELIESYGNYFFCRYWIEEPEMKSTKEIKRYPNGEQYIEFSDEEMEVVGWSPGDTLVWKDNQDGSFTLSKKKDTEWVLVEVIQQYRMRYCVEVSTGKADWALDTVAMQEAKEFSQKDLGEVIVSHRVVSEQEALDLCREDNDYVSSWDDGKLKASFFHAEGDKVDL